VALLAKESESNVLHLLGQTVAQAMCLFYLNLSGRTRVSMTLNLSAFALCCPKLDSKLIVYFIIGISPLWQETYPNSLRTGITPSCSFQFWANVRSRA
jgi:hypothetical protein